MKFSLLLQIWQKLKTQSVFKVAVQGFRVESRVDSVLEPEAIESSQSYHPYSRTLDPPYPDHTSYEAVFAGMKKPITVDCTQPEVICKFPLVVAEKGDKYPKPEKLINQVPIIKGVEVPDDNSSKVEGREDSDEKVDGLVIRPRIDTGDVKLPVFKESLDVESIVANEKDVEDTWILEKNVLNRKYQIPVKLIPSRHNPGAVSPVYPLHHDFHDHFNGGDLYHRHESGWTPWTRAYPSVYHYPSNQPCQPPVHHQPPVYHHPPPQPCTPTRKPVINIDDKVEKIED